MPTRTKRDATSIPESAAMPAFAVDVKLQTFQTNRHDSHERTAGKKNVGGEEYSTNFRKTLYNTTIVSLYANLLWYVSVQHRCEILSRPD